MTGRVVKQRTGFRLGRTRVHLDRVDGLGDSLELEVELREGARAEHVVTAAQALLASLQPVATQLVSGAHVTCCVH